MKLKGSEIQVEGKLKQQYGDLTEDDPSIVEGKENELIGKF